MLDDLTKLISLLVVLSVAAERLVEILKGFVFTTLNTVDPDPVREARRQAKVQLLAVIVSLFTAIIVKLAGQFPPSWGWLTTLALGFLASGGSSLWNSVLGWVKGLKDVSLTQGAEARLQAQATGRAMAAERQARRTGGVERPPLAPEAGVSLTPRQV